MYKYILLVSAILLMSSCEKEPTAYKYKVVGKWCITTGTYIHEFSTTYLWYTEHFPYLSWNTLNIYRNTNDWEIFDLEIDLSICDFSYTRTPLKNNPF